MGQRYRVFLNEKSIQISEDINNTDYLHVSRVIHFKCKDQLELEYERFKTDTDCDKLEIYAGIQYKEAVSAFNSFFKPVKAAGGIVKNSDGKLLFIKRNDIWDLPKGKLEKKESPEQAGLREVSEETGLSLLTLIRRLPSTFHIYSNRRLQAVLKETNWYEMYYSGSAKPVPQTAEDITEVRWFEPNQLDEVLGTTYASLKELIAEYLASPFND